MKVERGKDKLDPFMDTLGPQSRKLVRDEAKKLDVPVMEICLRMQTNVGYAERLLGPLVYETGGRKPRRAKK